ncbi:Ig-like V-type domain-containing protein FAM187A [Tachypleus tridentatus]|uniref:Ig-like V-type domain-containing protein FAM187A n=1 Tax=Tachypleus tridentatus TaxID=6853 RepID=UPI003FD576FD
MVRNIEKLYIFILIRMIILEEGDAKNLLISGTKHAKPIATRTHDDYQKCQQEKASQKNPEALLVLEGSDVRLTCDGLCLNPSQSAKEIWRHLDEKTTSVMYVPLDGLRKKIRSDLSLSLHNILTKDSGVYFCYKDGKNYVTYHVDVKKTEPTTVVRQSGKKGPFAKKEKHLGKNNLLIFTKWSKWSPCDRCGKVGRRRRVGFCMIKKLKANRPVVPEDVRILSSYPDGIPCRSTLLPEKLKNLKDIKERKSENMVGFCKVYKSLSF